MGAHAYIDSDEWYDGRPLDFSYSPIEEMDLQIRTYNVLKDGGIHTIRDLLRIPNKEGLIKIKNMGKKAYEDVIQRLELYGFQVDYTNAAGNQDMIKIELNYSLRAHLFEPMTRTFATDRYARTYGFFGGDRAVLLGAGRGGAAGGRGAGRPAPDGNAFPRPEGPEHTMPRRGVDPLDTARYILAARSAIEREIY